jgi:hypothetical protein
MAIDKLVPQYLNKDEDERLVKPFEMTDALNIRISPDHGGDQGIVRNIKGNTIVNPVTTDDAIPSGTNRAVGAVTCESGKCIYFFVYNSNLNHGIYKYDFIDDKYIKLYQDPVLNFSRDGFIKADVIINQFEEHLLYFTDNRNEPRKINATRLLYNGYGPNLTSGTSIQKEKFFTVCKPPPQSVPTFKFGTNESVGQNNLRDNCFQFAYQYIYDDGEVSAISAYSPLAVSSTNLAFNSTSIQFASAFNNELAVTVSNSDGPVDKIRVFARRNNDGAFFKVKELSNDPQQTEQTFTFRNDKIYSYVSSEEVNRTHDAVPRVASAQAISNSRLFYGNYLEGFDNLPQPDVYSYPVYHPELSLSGSTNFDFFGGTNGIQNETLGLGQANANFGSTAYNQYYGAQRALVGGGIVNNFWLALFGGTDSVNLMFARYDDSTTNGISFEIDLSNFPDEGIDASGSQISMNFSMSCDKFGMNPDLTSTASGTRFAVSASTFEPGGDLIHEQNLIILDPDSRHSGIGNLKFQSPLLFALSETGQNFQNIDAFGAWVSDAILNNMEEATVGLSPIVEGPNWFFNGATAFFAGTAGYSLDGSVPSSQAANCLLAWMSGTGTFKVASAAYNSSTQKITCQVKCTGLSLSTDVALAPTFTQLSNAATIANDFVSPNTTNYYGNGLNSVASAFTTPGQYSHSMSLLNSSEVSLNIGSGTNGDGYAVQDYSVDSGAIRSHWKNYNFLGGELSILSEDGDAVTTFKAGATHDFGIVYYDHRNRPSGVQPLEEKSVRHFGQRPGNNNGRTEIDFRLLHEPPSWATKWAPVYSKNTSYDEVLQVLVNEAATGKQTTFTDIRSSDGEKTRPILSGLEGGINGQIFISLRGLEGKSNSYKDFKGANKSYEYNEGDILRILQYEDLEGNIQRPLHEFKITSYKFYTDNDENPIRLSQNSPEVDETNYRRTGWYLTIRDNNISNFKRSDILIGRDFFSQNCLVEICRPKRGVEEESRVYYETGKQYDILEVGGVRTHAGDRSNSVSPAVSIQVLTPTVFTSTTRLYLGDKLIIGSGAGEHVFIEGIVPNSSGVYTYTVYSGQPFTTSNVSGGAIFPCVVDSAVGSANSLHKGVVTLTKGDMYLRIREQLGNSKTDYTPNGSDITFKYDPTIPDNQIYRKFIIEDGSVSDYFDSKAISIGRPFIETPDQEEIRRATAITYSAPFVSDSNVLNLSTFNPLLFSYKDYNSINGSVCSIIDKGESLLVMQEKKIGSTPIDRTLIQSAGKDGMLVTSTNVLGTETYFAGTFGPGLNPESVVDRFGVTYFCDMDAGKVFSLSSKGIQPISEVKMSAFFENLFADLLLRDSIPRIPCGIDPENDEFIVTVESQDVNEIVIGTLNVGNIPKPPANPLVSGAVGKIKPVVGGSNMLSWSTDPIKWDDTNITPVSFLPEWDSVGGALVVIDKLTERGSSFVSPNQSASTSDFKADVITSDGKYRGVAKMNMVDGSIIFSTTIIEKGDSSDVSKTITITDGVDDDGKTLAYSTDKNFWLSFYSFNPELYSSLHNRFFSFEAGQIYRHNVNETRNNFYGTQNNSEIEIVSKKNPSSVKVYNAISLEGNDTWAGVVTNSNQTTSIPEAMYEEKEGIYYTNIPNDVSVDANDSSGTERVVLGEVASLAGAALNFVTFTGRVSNLPFGIGDTVKAISGSGETNLGLTISSIKDRNTLVLSGAATGQIGNTLVAVSSNVINGEQMRDYYAKIKLTNDNTAEKELYAVNAVYTASPLDNSQTN